MSVFYTISPSFCPICPLKSHFLLKYLAISAEQPTFAQQKQNKWEIPKTQNRVGKVIKVI